MTEPSFDREISEVLVDFTRTLADEQSVEAVFGSLGNYTTELLGVDGIGVLLLEEGELRVATTNSKRGEAAEHLEVELGEGPCTESIRSGRHVLVPDLEQATERFPEFAWRALEAGVRGIHALPIGSTVDHLIGSLNIVTTEPRLLSGRDLRVADMLAEVAVSYLVSIQAHEQANELAAQLQRALDSRVVIEQAKGILTGRHGIELDDAFERLRNHARSNRQRIHDVARSVCEGDLDLD